MTKEGGLLYFHRNAILTGDFDKMRRGDEVYYVEDIGDTGADCDQGLGERRVAVIHRTATMNSRGKRSSTFPSNRGL